MNAFNEFLTAVFGWLLFPLSNHPLILLLVCGAVVGVLMSLVFKYTSNQSTMASVLDRSRGHILAIKLFKDDLRGMFFSLGCVFYYILLRLWYSVVPVMVLIVPLYFVMSQLFLRFEYRPLAIGEEGIVELQIDGNSWERNRDATMRSDPGFTIETEPLRDENGQSIFWRVEANQPGLSKLRWQLGDSTMEKEIVAAEDCNRLLETGSRRPGTGWLDRTWHAAEPALEQLPVRAVVVHYPQRETPIFGFKFPWWVTFFAVSMITALLAQPLLKVRF